MSARLFRVLFFIVVLSALAIAFAPASLVIPKRPGVFTYERADGTIWNARFEGAQLASLDAGAVDWRLSVPDAFQGRMKARVVLRGRDVAGDANLLATLRGERRLNAHLRIERAPLGRLRLEGPTRIENLDISFAGGRCTAARGTIVSEIPSKNAALLRWRGPDLSGTAVCDGEAALLTLEGAGEGSALRSVLELHADGEGIWRAEVRSDREGGVRALGAAGFLLGPEARSGAAKREFRWFPF